MNIILINQYAGSPRHGMEFRPYYMAREWMRRGHRVVILAGSYSHLRSENPASGTPFVAEKIDGIEYVWLRTQAYAGNGYRRGLSILTFVGRLLQTSFSSVLPARCDVVIASSTHTLDIFPAWLIAKRTGARLVFEVHDLWPLSPMELSGMSPWHPFIMALQLGEDFACRRASKIVSILPKTQEYLESRGMHADKWTHVPNGICSEEWEQDRLHAPVPRGHAEALAEMKREGYFIIGYAGAHGVANALDNFVRAAKLLQSVKIACVAVGGGPEKARLEKLVGEQRIVNFRFLPPVPKNAIPALLERFDALYVGLAPCGLFRYGISPNKLIDYMMAGRPIVMAVKAGNDPVAASGAGLTVLPDDPASLAAAIIRLSRLTAQARREMGRRGRAYAVANHEYGKLASDFLATISRG